MMRKEHGLTLVEVLVALAIIVVLAVGVYTVTNRSTSQQPQPSPIPTPTPSEKTSPTTAPTNSAASAEGKIAFVRDGDIWLINPDGSGEEKITATRKEKYQYQQSERMVGGADAPLAWSTDGKKLAFNVISDRYIEATLKAFKANDLNLMGPLEFRDYDLWVYDVGTRKFEKIKASHIGMKLWFDDNRKIFGSYIPPGRSYYLVDLVKQNAQGGSFDDASTDFFPESINSRAGIVYGTGSGYMPESDKMRYGIYQFIPGAVNPEIIDDSVYPDGLDLSPGGSILIYATQEGLWSYDLKTGVRQQLVTTEEKAKGQQLLTSGRQGSTYSYPKVSPDGQIVMLQVERTTEGVGPGQLLVAFYHFDNQTLDELATDLWGFGLQGASWSPDSQSIVFGFAQGQGAEPEQTGLWKLNVKTGEKAQLTTNASSPAWQPQ